MIRINNDEYEFETGETILEVARRNGISIPTLCNLKGTRPTGACRICIVEVGKMSAPVASCSTPAAPGMDVRTDSPRIRKARKTIIELLMISGNHNCAAIGNSKSEMTDFMQEVTDYDGSDNICTAYGECELQALAYQYMVNNRTLERIPTNYPLENNDPLIGRDFSRCILCGRCVQACTEVTGNNAISHGYRGNVAKIVARGDKPLPDSECVYCGECLQVCPVGALFEQRSKYDQRLWNISRETSTCHYCGIGCRIDVSLKDKKIVKIDGKIDTDPNRGQLCFKGRFAFDFLYSDKRIVTPMVRSGGKLIEATWETAYRKIADKVNEISKKFGNDAIGCVISPRCSNEDLFLVKKYIEEISGNGNIAHPEPFSKARVEYSRYSDFHCIVLVGIDVARDNPVAGNFIREANRNGAALIEINNKTTELSKFADERFTAISKFKPAEDTNYLVIHSPEYDMSSLAGKTNISLNSLSRENNTIGAYMTGILSSEYTAMTKKKMLFALSSVDIKGFEAEFVVAVDSFPHHSLRNADVILPPALWIESEGTYVNAHHNIYKIKKIADPPGEARPVWKIFSDLLEIAGSGTVIPSPEYIWKNMIRKELDPAEKCSYKELNKSAVRIRDSFFKNLRSQETGIKYEKFLAQSILCNQCEGLKDVTEKRMRTGE